MRHPVQALLIAFSLSLAAPATFARATADVPLSEDYVLRVWDLEDGLTDNHVGSIARDRQGYLWLTNFSGLFRFDGLRFVHVDDELVAGLPTSRPSPALLAQDGSLWFGMERGGIGRIRDRTPAIMLPGATFASFAGWPSSLVEGKDGAIWAGAYEIPRITRVGGDGTAIFGPDQGVPSGKEIKLCVAGDGTVWAAATGGYAIFDGHRFNEIDPGAGGALRPALACSRDGGMWVSRGGKLLKYDNQGKRLETLSPAWFQDISQINVLREDASGTLWIGTLDSGLFCYKSGRFERVHTSFNDIYCLTEDGDGNLWCGVWGGGLNRLSPRRYFMRQVQPDVPGEVVRSICEDEERRFWAVGRYGRVSRSEMPGSNSFQAVVPPAGTWRASAVIAATGSGVWLGTAQGLERWKNGVFSQTALREPVISLLAEGDETVWAGTEFGSLSRYSEGRVESIGHIRAARGMALDQNGDLWVGTERGELFRRRKGTFEPVPFPDAESCETVRFIVPDGDALWIGVLQGGLYRCRNGRLQKVPVATKGTLREPRCLVIERQNPANVQPSSPTDVFWIGTATGLLRTTRGAIDSVLDGGSGKLELLSLGANEGLPNAEFSPGFQNGAIRSSDGRLCFGTNLGLLEIPPNTTSKRPPSGQVLIEEAVSNNLALYAPGSGPWVFPPNPDVIRIRYTLPELSTPEQVRFRYRLKGSDEESRWIDVGRQREITLVQPAPGSFYVEVTAAVGDGPWLGTPAVAEFTVRATWWETPAFRWGVVLASIGLAAVLARAVEMQRMRARIRRLEQEHAIERERARIARDMHDEVGANLTHIATATRLATLDSPSAVGEHLRDIETAARHTVESLDEIVWAVNPRNDTVAKTVEYICKFATNFLSKAGIQPEIAVPETLPEQRISAETRHHLFLAVKETINNVAKHSAATHAKVQVQTTADRLQVVVSDNGRGFDAGSADSFSDGLINMRERMAAIGGRCEVESRPAVHGCRITFELPLCPPS